MPTAVVQEYAWLICLLKRVDQNCGPALRDFDEYVALKWIILGPAILMNFRLGVFKSE